MSIYERRNAFRIVRNVKTTLENPNHIKESGGKPALGGVRFFCIDDSPMLPGRFARWFLQIRALIETKSGTPGKRFGISTAPMSREDLVWLRDQIDAELRRCGNRDDLTGRRGE